MKPSVRICTMLAILPFTALVVGAAPVDFVRDVRPIFQDHCYACHGAEKQKSGLRLDMKSIALKGGDEHGPDIVPGKSSDSPLMQFVRGQIKDKIMPAKGPRLTSEQIEILGRWIDEGAIWPDGVDLVTVVNKRDYWCYKPLVAPPVPASDVSNPIDAFVEAKLAENKLTLSPQADRRTLIRRLYFVLHGLPPTPEEVESFAKDGDPHAYDNLVDRLLASPRYGERWARHWLDVVAFGETHGFEVNTPRENAWPYRDYVINAFNKDTPYPRFILEQLAGDSVGEDSATGFIVARAALLSGQIGKDEESKLRARQDELNDMVGLVGGSFLGLTLHCARCHDHKFDPILQTDYYGLQAIFAGVRHGERELRSADANAHDEEQKQVRQSLTLAIHRLIQLEPAASISSDATAARPPVNAHRNVDRFAPIVTNKIRFTVLATSENNRYQPCIDEVEIYNTQGQNIALANAGAKAVADEHTKKKKAARLNDGYYGNEAGLIFGTKGAGWVEIDLAKPQEIEAVVWGRDRLDRYHDRLAISYRIEAAHDDDTWQVVATSRDRAEYVEGGKTSTFRESPTLTASQIPQWHEIIGEISESEGKLKTFSARPMVYAGQFETPGPSYRLNRGDATQPREQVYPSAVAAIGSPLKLAADTPEQQRRITLANWLAEPANPLPARVLVNRLWEHQFGEGIVATPNDFGRNGALPTNQALLDWLASEFIRGGWSIKHIQRLIVTSATWKQASAPRIDGLAADAQDRLLWRYPPRRMEAEAVRDGMLAIAGTLDLRMGGPGFSVFAPNFNYVRVYDPRPQFGPPEWRRMIYMTKVRVAQDSTFGSFDCPDAGQSQPKRPRSTTAIQALSLFNSGFVEQQSDVFAARLQREAPDGIPAQVRRAFELAFQRDPAADEAQVCETLAREHGLSTLCRVLFNANEGMFIP